LSLAWVTPAPAQEGPELAADQPQFETETVPVYRVERMKTLLVPTQGRARVLILNPEVVEVDQVTDTYLIFRGLRIDSTIVHLFEGTQRRSIRIEVTELTSLVTETEQRKKEMLRQKLGLPQRTLKFRYRGTERHLERGDAVSLPGTNEQNRIRTHDLTARMGVPLGELQAKMYLEQRRDVTLDKEVTQPRHLSAELDKVNLGPLGRSDWVAGDKDLDLSTFTIDSKRYRGFGLFPSRDEKYLFQEKSGPDRPLALSLFGGEERQGYGLDLPAGLQTRSARSHFAGGKAEVAVLEHTSLYMTGLHRYGKGGETRSDDVFAAGLNGAWLEERVQMKAEAARNGPEGAYEVETRTHLPAWFRTRNRFWRAGKQYKTVTGPVAEDGQTGWRGRADADLKLLERDLSLFAESTIYRDQNALNPVNPREINTAYTAGGAINLPGEFWLRGSAGYQDESASPLPYVNRLYDLDLNREIRFGGSGWVVRSVTPFVGYRQSEYDKSNNIPGFDARLRMLRTGARASFIGGFWGAVSWSTGRLKESNPQTLPDVIHPEELVLEAGKNHTFRAIPASLNLSVRYENVRETFQKTHQPFSDRDRFAADGRFSWRLGKDREAFAEMSVTRQKPETTGGDPIVDLFAQFGVQILWDTGWAWTQKGGVNGEVFKDLNANGRRDPEEPGLAGIRVYVEGGPETRTGPSGRYRLRGIPEGPAVVRADPAQIPKGYFFTTPNGREIVVFSRKEQKMDFGVSTEVEFRGIVFNDLNENHQYDEGFDLPVQGVRLLLESGQSSASGADGFYSIRKAVPGEHTLSVDLQSIPDGYRTLVPVQQAFQTAEGDVVRWDLPLKAQRSVIGSVFVDVNLSGRREPDEKGIEGVRLRLDGQQAVSGADGGYRFLNIHPGRYAVTPDPAGLPSGYRFAWSNPLRVEVPEGPFLRERFDFPVIPVDGPEPPQPESSREPVLERPAAPSEGEVSVKEFKEAFADAPVPEGTRRVYLRPASRTTVFLYAPETLRPGLEELVSLGSAGLPGEIRVQLFPLPEAASDLRRPALIIRDALLEPVLTSSDLPAVELFLGEPGPPLTALVLEALRGEPGVHRPRKLGGMTTVRHSAGQLYWAWFIE